MISMLRTVCAMRGVALGARPSGKLKAVVQATVNFLIVILMIPFSMGLITLEELRFVSFIAVSVAAAYTLLSSIDYLYANRGHIKQFIAT